MRILSIIQIAKQYFLLGIVGAFIATTLFLVGYYIVYKRIMKGTKKLKLSKVILWIIFLIYIVIVLGATIGIRGLGSYENSNIHLFSSYKDAWNSFSIGQWRNLILNILMFVPFGFMLPLLFKKCESWYITYIAGLAATLFIEILQLISKRGIFELDDILNNTIGCMIGYGIIMIFLLVCRKNDCGKKYKGLRILSYQIPLIMTIISFTVIFVSYYRQELGNLNIKNSYKIDMSTVDVNTKIKLDDEEGKVDVYQVTMGTKEDAAILATKVFNNLNTKIDESQNDEYDETIVFKSQDEKYHLWVDYKGLTTWYTDFTSMEGKGKEGLTYEEVKNMLIKFNINLPEEASFIDEGEGAYTISLDMAKSQGNILDGRLTCNINENYIVSGFDNDIITYKPYKKYDILSLKEAYSKILNGEFKTSGIIPKNSRIEVTDVKLNYQLDSKGYYQPVYNFKISGISDLNNIFISALKNVN